MGLCTSNDIRTVPNDRIEGLLTEEECLLRFGMRNPVPIWRRTYDDYLTDEQLLLRIKKNPHKGDLRHLITFDFLVHVFQDWERLVYEVYEFEH